MNPRLTALILVVASAVGRVAKGQAPSPPSTTASLRGLSVAVDGTIWASGSSGTVLRSIDGGTSWELHPIPDAASLDIRDVEAMSATVAFAMVAGADTARLYRTNDGGASWVRQYNDTRKSVFLDGVAFWDATHGIAAGDPMDGRFLVLRTEDGGAHWTVLEKAASPAALPGEAAFAASGTAVVTGSGGRAWLATGGATGGAGMARVFRSVDYGKTWDVSDTPIPAGTPSTGIFSLAFRDSLNGIAVGGDYANPGAGRPNVAITSDGGRTWRLADSARVTPYLSGVAYVAGNGAGVAAVGTTGVFESADGGRTWARRDSVGYNAVAALRTQQRMVAVGERGRTALWTALAREQGRSGESAPPVGRAMISSSSEPASQAGIEILRRGGNAIDAAVAVGFALAVTLPAAGNLGGGGFLVYQPAGHPPAALDFREVAPRAASRDMYLDSTGHRTDKSLVGHLASGVPGSVAGLTEALRRYGSLPLRDVLAPAIRLARDGFTVDSAMARSLAGAQPLIARFDGAAVFLPGGAPLAPGTLLRQPALARTLERIAERGPDGFYQGDVANQIVAEMRRGGGFITGEDLRAYRPVWREPLVGSYRGFRLVAMPLSSSGGIALIETLNMLEVRSKLPPFGTASYEHLLAEAFRRAFVDRNTRLGDPAFVSVPLPQLVSKPYAAWRAATIDPLRASPTPAFEPAASSGTHTTSYSVVDETGNAAAVTVTLNSSYGSGVYLRDGGFFLNNEMDDFATAPGRPNQFGLIEGERNAIAPGKRMLSSMTPTIVLDSASRPLLVLGAAGGPTIITAVAQVIVNLLDHHMAPAQAVAAPRIHHQAWPDSLAYELDGFGATVLDSLRAMGYALDPRTSIATLNAIIRAGDAYVGIAEPRYARAGAVGY